MMQSHPYHCHQFAISRKMRVLMFYPWASMPVPSLIQVCM
uniref:Uncharacterized protein n=1 Tax=Rhizophora mucronata TaxID=61149 RepID=A0A2P2QV30_RHIMU